VLDEYRLGQVNIQFADVFDIIADPFYVLCNKQQTRRTVRGRRVLSQRFDQAVKNPSVCLIERLIACDYCPRGRRVAVSAILVA